VESEQPGVSTQSATHARQKTLRTIKNAVILALIFGGLFIKILLGKRGTHSRELIVLAIVAAVIIILNLFPLLLQWTVGTIGLVQISFPEFEQRIRTRYQAETSALAELGFYHVFFAGDDISVFRLFLIFPIMIVFSMGRNRVPMTVQDGRLRTGNPVFISRDKSTFAHPNSFGVTFHTAFQDGTVLVSKNFGDDTRHLSAIVGNSRPGTDIGGLWAAHQERLQMLVAEGRRINGQSSFQAYAEIIHKEQTRG
jgi:hypothetical protein